LGTTGSVGAPGGRPPGATRPCRAILDEELDLEGEAKTEWSAEDFDSYLDRSDHLRELCAFAVSEECFQARQALGVTAQSTEDETLP